MGPPMRSNLQAKLFPSRQRDRVIRRRLSLWEPEPAKNKTLMELYRYWESLRPEGLIPARKDFDILRLRPVMGTTTLVDVEAEDPMDFRFRLLGTELTLKIDTSMRTIADYRESAVYQEMLVQDYGAARDIGTPLYHEIAALVDYITHSYVRLILPFAADGRKVNQLMVCSIHEDLPDLVKLLH